MEWAILDWIGLILAALASVIGWPVYQRLGVLGLFRSNIENIHGTDLRIIANTVACEDLHLDHATAELYTACQGDLDRRSAWFPPLGQFDFPASQVQGSIVVIDAFTMKAKALTLKNFDRPLQPHGIDILTDPQDPSSTLIYVVSHLANPDYYQASPPTSEAKISERIEVFRRTAGEDEAVHVRSVEHPLIRTPNDVVATGPNSFYVTNDHKYTYTKALLRVAEDVGERRIAAWTDLVHVEFDPQEQSPSAGVSAEVVLTTIHNNNGLGRGRPGHDELNIIDASGGLLYRARPHDGNRTIHLIEHIQLDSTLDNPFYYHDAYATASNNASGYLLAGLARGFKMESDFPHPERHIPPLVWHVRNNQHVVEYDKPNQWEKRLIFQDDGKTLRSASSAVLVGIDPADNEGKKQGWLFVTGFASKAMIATKIDL